MVWAPAAATGACVGVACMSSSSEAHSSAVPSRTWESSVIWLTYRERRRLGERVDDLVLLSTLDERPPVQRDRVDLLELARAEVGDADVAVVGDSVTVEADTRLVARAVRNLVANARRHAPSSVTVSVERQQDRAWVHVDDDGPGIPPAQRATVFERFARLDEARSTDRGGAGLGLAIVAGVADAHGGGTLASDAPTGGARVSICFPA